MNRDNLIKQIDKKIESLNELDGTGVLYWNEFRDFIKNYKEESDKVDWDKLMKLFNEICGKQMRVVNEKVKRQIRARLREGYTREMIINAMKYSLTDPYHIETKNKYITLEYISRGYVIDKYQEPMEADKSQEGFQERSETYNR